jgi:cyanate permease
MPMAALVINLIAGMIVDRLGVKRFLIATCFLAGISGAVRGLSGDFAVLMITSLISFIFIHMVPVCVHNIASLWFDRSQRGLAQGCMSAGMGFGFTLGSMISATVISPLVGGWRNVLFLYGLISVIIGFTWFILKGSKTQARLASSGESVSFFKSLVEVSRIKGVWVIGVVLMGYMACMQGTLGYLPLFLRNSGWSPAAADGALSLYNLTGACGALLLSYLSDRMGNRRGIVGAILLVTTVCTALVFFVSGNIIWLLVVLLGIGRDAMMAICNAMNFELKEVGPDRSGTALGLQGSISRPGAIISPPLGNILAGFNIALPFVFWAAFAGFSFVFFFLSTVRNRETG